MHVLLDVPLLMHGPCEPESSDEEIRPPLYPLALIGSAMLTNPFARAINIEQVLRFQKLVAAFSAALLFWLMIRRQSRPVFAFVVICYLILAPVFSGAMDRSLWIHDTAYSVTLLLFLIWTHERAFKTRSIPSILLAALALGVALGFRSEFLYFAVCLLPLWFFTGTRPRRAFLIHALAIAGVLIGWGVYNWQANGKFVVTRTQGPQNLVEGLGGYQSSLPFSNHDAYAWLSAQLKARNIPPHGTQADRFLSSQFWRLVRQYPGAALSVWGRRAADVLKTFIPLGWFFPAIWLLSLPEAWRRRKEAPVFMIAAVLFVPWFLMVSILTFNSYAIYPLTFLTAPLVPMALIPWRSKSETGQNLS